MPLTQRIIMVTGMFFLPSLLAIVLAQWRTGAEVSTP
jgi:hypothetical protein